MSNPPVFNSITVYGTYLSPRDCYLETRIPVKRFGFLPTRVKNRKEHLIFVPEDDISNVNLRLKSNEAIGDFDVENGDIIVEDISVSGDYLVDNGEDEIIIVGDD